MISFSLCVCACACVCVGVCVVNHATNLRRQMRYSLIFGCIKTQLISILSPDESPILHTSGDSFSHCFYARKQARAHRHTLVRHCIFLSTFNVSSSPPPTHTHEHINARAFAPAGTREREGGGYFFLRRKTAIL